MRRTAPGRGAPSVIDTPARRLRERRPDVFEGSALGTRSPFGWSNAANTAPLPWGDRLFATWDAGRPVEVDPVTLGFVADVGHRRRLGFGHGRAAVPPGAEHRAPGDRSRPRLPLDRRPQPDAAGRRAHPLLGRRQPRRALAGGRRAGAAVDAHHHPDPRLVDPRRLRLPGGPQRDLRPRRADGHDLHRRARLPDPQGRGGRDPRRVPGRCPHVPGRPRGDALLRPVRRHRRHHGALRAHAQLRARDARAGRRRRCLRPARRSRARRHVQPPDAPGRGHGAAVRPRDPAPSPSGRGCGSPSASTPPSSRPWTGAPRG